MTLSRDALILKLNEIYHDLEHAAYDGKHPDILEVEVPRWRKVGLENLAGPRPAMDILDIGSGTGFVPLQLLDWLGPEDRLTCSDVSAVMLENCKANLMGAGLRADLRLLKLGGSTFDLPDHSQDLITVNAVMHHLPKPAETCLEIDRILRPGGRVVIGHEPTRTHLANRLLAWNYWLVLPIADPKLFGYEIILRLGLFEILRGPLGRWVPELERHNALLRAVNERLLKDGDIAAPLGAAKLSSLLDAQSPTAGGSHRDRGFARGDFATYFPGYVIGEFETYKHLNKIHPRYGWLRRYEDWLARRFPEDGSSLFCGLRKPGG